ncbi:MAG: hypothetical protein KDE66_06080 [Nitrosomonas sp.]|nr:hypothetical protein [Nitrosomonas sp.]
MSIFRKFLTQLSCRVVAVQKSLRIRQEPAGFIRNRSEPSGKASAVFLNFEAHRDYTTKN